MNKQQILKKIGSIIQELKEQHEYLEHVEEISELELELFAAHADFLNDHIAILKRLSEVKPNALAEEKGKEEIDEKLIEEAVVKEEPESSSAEKKSFFSFSLNEEPGEMVFDFEKKIAVEEVFDRVLSDEEKALIDEKKAQEKTAEVEEVKDEEMAQEEDVVEEEVIAVPIVEKIVEEKPEWNTSEASVSPKGEEKRLTLNEMLSSKLGGRATSSTPKAIEDLKSAISLNDKMIFIKELFNGYNLAYSEAVEIINRFDSFEAADNFLQKNYAKKNDWENKQTTVDRFYAYLNRKFVM